MFRFGRPADVLRTKVAHFPPRQFSTLRVHIGKQATGYRRQVRQRCRIRSARPGHPVYLRRILFILSLHTRCPAADGPSCRFGFYSPRCARNSRRPGGSRNCRADSLVFLVPGDEKKISEKRTSVDQHHERARRQRTNYRTKEKTHRAGCRWLLVSQC